MFSNDLSWSSHIDYIISKAHWIFFLIKHTFSISSPLSVKRQLYLSLVLPLLTYCSPSGVPILLRTYKLSKMYTEGIVNDPSLDYKQCLSHLNLLPLMYLLEIADIMFAISSTKNPSHHFNINHHVSFSNSGIRSSSTFKLQHSLSNNNKSRHSFYSCLPRLWNSLPPTDPTQSSRQIKHLLISHLTDYFNSNFSPENSCSFHYLCPCNSCNLIVSISNHPYH